MGVTLEDRWYGVAENAINGRLAGYGDPDVLARRLLIIGLAMSRIRPERFCDAYQPLERAGLVEINLRGEAMLTAEGYFWYRSLSEAGCRL